MRLRRSRPATVVLAVCSLLLLAVAPSATAQTTDAFDQQSAEAALEQVEQILDAPEGSDPHALTPALADLARQKSELDAADRRRARAILARPPSGTGPGAWSPAAAAAETQSCTEHFCFHWVNDAGRPDAPNLADGDGNGRPDYVDLVAASFERSFAVEVGDLGWRTPVSDGTRGGGSGLVDVYLSDIGPTFGFAVPEGTARSAYGYLVIDNDFSDAEFPAYDGVPTVPAQVTAAHEFNHILQFAYDADQDPWMLEASATWVEEKVFDDANDYVNYVDSWAALPEQPITDDGNGPPTDHSDLKMYGSALWNHWLERRYAAQVVREAWAISMANSVSMIGFAPGAYDRAIKNTCGPGFAFEFQDFSSSVAEWQAPNSGIHEGASFLPVEVKRTITDVEVDGAAVNGTVDHTAFRLHDVPNPPAGPLHLTGSLPSGTPGSIALVGRRADGTMVKTLGILNANGRGTVTLDPGSYERVTAVVTNADTSHRGFSGSDWLWSRDAQAYTLAVSTTAPGEPAATAPPAFTPCPPTGPPPPPPPPPPPAPTPTPAPTVTPTVTPVPTVEPPPATSVRLARSTKRLRSVLRSGRLALFARTNKAGRMSARATVDRRTARRLRVGRRTTKAGTGRRTATAPARLKINVKLTRKLRAALKRNRRRAVKVKVTVTFTPTDGTRAVRRTLKVNLKP